MLIPTRLPRIDNNMLYSIIPLLLTKGDDVHNVMQKVNPPLASIMSDINGLRNDINNAHNIDNRNKNIDIGEVVQSLSIQPQLKTGIQSIVNYRQNYEKMGRENAMLDLVLSFSDQGKTLKNLFSIMQMMNSMSDNNIQQNSQTNNQTNNHTNESNGDNKGNNGFDMGQLGNMLNNLNKQNNTNIDMGQLTNLLNNMKKAFNATG